MREEKERIRRFTVRLRTKARAALAGQTNQRRTSGPRALIGLPVEGAFQLADELKKTSFCPPG